MAMLISPCKMSTAGCYGLAGSQNGHGRNTGRILMAEKLRAIKQTLRMSLPIMGIALVMFAVLIFPVISFYGKTLVLYAPQKASQREYFGGRVLGSHTFETEYGEITLNHFTEITSASNTVSRIGSEVFTDGTGFHNLVVEGIEIPKRVSIGFKYHPNRISSLLLESQEVTVSGIPLKVWIINMGSFKEDANADIDIQVVFDQGSIVLSDSTHVDFMKMNGGLLIYKDKKQWKLYTLSRLNLFLVQLPSETELTRYKSITYREKWGGFIEGELFEE
jgi:hypothetical protein